MRRETRDSKVTPSAVPPVVEKADAGTPRRPRPPAGLPAVHGRHDWVAVDVGGDRNGVRACHDAHENVAVPDVVIPVAADVVANSCIKNAVRPTPRRYVAIGPGGHDAAEDLVARDRMVDRVDGGSQADLHLVAALA